MLQVFLAQTLWSSVPEALLGGFRKKASRPEVDSSIKVEFKVLWFLKQSYTLKAGTRHQKTKCTGAWLLDLK